jgi:hypothetical protein
MKAVVPDNLKVGITKPSRYEPDINRTYQELADHYGFVKRGPHCREVPTRQTAHSAFLLARGVERRGS